MGAAYIRGSAQIYGTVQYTFLDCFFFFIFNFKGIESFKVKVLLKLVCFSLIVMF